MRHVWRLAAVALVVVMVADRVPYAAPASGLRPLYRCEGEVPQGKYRAYLETRAFGTLVEFRQLGQHGQMLIAGQGVVRDGRFTGFLVFGRTIGVVTYRVKGAKLDGVWLAAGDRAATAETCTAIDALPDFEAIPDPAPHPAAPDTTETA